MYEANLQVAGLQLETEDKSVCLCVFVSIFVLLHTCIFRTPPYITSTNEIISKMIN